MNLVYITTTVSESLILELTFHIIVGQIVSLFWFLECSFACLIHVSCSTNLIIFDLHTLIILLIKDKWCSSQRTPTYTRKLFMLSLYWLCRFNSIQCYSCSIISTTGKVTSQIKSCTPHCAVIKYKQISTKLDTHYIYTLQEHIYIYI
jgi:hypothetical protein